MIQNFSIPCNQKKKNKQKKKKNRDFYEDVRSISTSK